MSAKYETAKKEVLVKEVELIVLEVEANAVIVKLDGWRKRVYSNNETAIEKLNAGNTIKVKYTGNIEDVHSVVFEKL